MNKAHYDILFDKTKIGTTQFEHADVPMGVVFGKIVFTNINSGYDFIRHYCINNNIEFIDYPEEKLILTENIPKLQITSKDGIDIKGLGASISGRGINDFEITVVGIPHPLYKQEFPHHVKSYREMFQKNKDTIEGASQGVH